MRLIFIDLHFHPRWANPAWELLEWDLQTEHDQIYEAAVHFATQVETAEPVEIQLKDWDAHTFVARLIAVSTQIVAFWEAFILLAGTGWGGGLMLTLLVGCQALLRSANPGLKRHGNGLSPALVDNLLLDVSLWVGRCSGQTFFPHVILCWVVG